MSIKRRLVLTFDAFGTLFSPKDTIGAQYALVAARHGLSGFSADQLNLSFPRAFKEARRRFPNYGRDSNMGPDRWWTEVIKETFRSCRTTSVPDSLVNALLTRFSTAEAYLLYPDILPFFRDLRARKAFMAKEHNNTDIVVGIISNSDNRVYSILQSFGFLLSPKRFSKDRSVTASPGGNDFDFSVYSYDAGFEKPDRRIFDAAKSCGQLPEDGTIVQYLYVHVGDNPVEDCQAAEQAGWKGVCVGGYGRNEGHVPKESKMLYFGDFADFAEYLWIDILDMENGRSQQSRN